MCRFPFLSWVSCCTLKIFFGWFKEEEEEEKKQCKGFYNKNIKKGSLNSTLVFSGVIL